MIYIYLIYFICRVLTVYNMSFGGRSVGIVPSRTKATELLVIIITLITY
jgi:hypothetical protein